MSAPRARKPSSFRLPPFTLPSFKLPAFRPGSSKPGPGGGRPPARRLVAPGSLVTGARTFLRWFAVAMVCAVGVPVLASVTIIGSLIFLPLPATLPAAKVGIVSQPSTVYAADGTPIALFRQFDQSVPVQQKDIPKILKDALVASEDKNFYHEGGVDPRGTLRAFVRDLQGKGYLQGGSTITQQYVGLAYTGKQRNLSRKLKQAVLASQLARQIPKDEILYKYLDAVYLGDGAYGVGAASETYFHKKVADLTIGEAALLIGLIPAPSRYEPRGNQVVAEQRRQVVLAKLLDQHFISPADFERAKVAQVYEATAPPLPAGAPETLVYPPRQESTKYPYFVDYLRRYLELQPSIGPDKLYRGGLRIQSSLDRPLQGEAEASVAKTLAGTPANLEMALVSVEPQTGHVRAMVGGRDFAADQTNLALGGCQSEAAFSPVIKATCVETQVPQGGGTGRQPGSAFKPFVLATALRDGIVPTEAFNGPSSIALPRGCRGAGCTVIHNAGDGESGVFSVAQATWFSVNTVYAQLILDSRVTIARTAQMAKDLGITSAWYSPKVHGASYALGALDVAPLDMASAYGVFDNHGVRAPATPVVRVVDAGGATVIDNSAPTGKRVLEAAIADNVTNILTGVITQPGATGYAAANIGRPAAGKTGTTSDFVDAWFVGYVPTLSTSVWLGFKTTEDPAKGASMASVCSGRHQGSCTRPVFGGTLPAETWAEYMKQATAGVPATDFDQPPPLVAVADAFDSALRGGIDPGTPRPPTSIPDGGPYMLLPAVPTPPRPVTPTTLRVPAPTTTVVSVPAPTTTTTTAPPGLGGLLFGPASPGR